MLLKDFYEILDQETSQPSSLRTRIKLNTEHRIYQGHFPGNPIVPGVCLIQIIQELMEILHNKKIFLRKSDNIKFLKAVNPQVNQILNIDVTLNDGKETHIKASVTFEDIVFLKFSGWFE